jgi:flagellar hook-basal body complex protein FliE
MEKVDASELLSQFRAMADMAKADFKSSGQTTVKTDFGALLKGAIDHVNDIQTKADQLETSFETGDSNVNLVEVMVALQKANVSFQAMTEVRNKLVSVYQDIMNMPM